MKYKYIAIEGNIGAGKTTLAKSLSRRLNAELILERFHDNPYLPAFYNDPKANALPLELSFLMDRVHQLEQLEKMETNAVIVSDYHIDKCLAFASNNLRDNDLDLFHSVFSKVRPVRREVDLIVFIDDEIQRLQERIKRRGRSYEQNISKEYLKNIEDVYRRQMLSNEQSKILLIDRKTVSYNFEEEGFLNLFLSRVEEMNIKRGINLY